MASLDRCQSLYIAMHAVAIRVAAVCEESFAFEYLARSHCGYDQDWQFAGLEEPHQEGETDRHSDVDRYCRHDQNSGCRVRDMVVARSEEGLVEEVAAEAEEVVVGRAKDLAEKRDSCCSAVVVVVAAAAAVGEVADSRVFVELVDTTHWWSPQDDPSHDLRAYCSS